MIEDGKGDAASSEEKTGVLELKASEKDQTLCEASNDVKKGDMRFSLCNGRSYASVAATNCENPRPRPPSRPRPSKQTTPQPKKKDKLPSGRLKTINLRGQYMEEGIVRVRDNLIYGLHYNALQYLRVITDVYEYDSKGYPSKLPSKLREATIDLLTTQGFKWEEEKENPGCFLVTFDGRPLNGIEKEEWSWVKKEREEAAAGRESEREKPMCC